MPSALHHIKGLVRAAGAVKAVEILVRRGLKLTKPVRVTVQDYGRVDVRPTDSDLFVLSQIFGWEEYKIDDARLETLRRTAASWQDAGDTPVIVDAGANVGYSALYFARLFPDACILAIEPGAATFRVLLKNVAGRTTIRAVNVALWSHGDGINLSHSTMGSWSNQVQEGVGTASARLDVLLQSIPKARPLLVKMDIEGAEREVIESCPDVFRNSECIMIEPHDFLNTNGACLYPLYKVASTRQFDTIINGENLLLFAVN
jgi:FkbM family methyltransferase